MNAIKLSESSRPEEIASIGLQCVREIFPIKDHTESDLAVRLRIEMLTDIVLEVGAERYLAAVKKAITISHNRYDVTIKKIRECAGLRFVPEPAPAYKAWQFVTEVRDRHVRRAPEGHWRLEPWYRVQEGSLTVVAVDPPPIPAPVQRAVQALGGWGALAMCPKEYWYQRLKDFVNVYDESGG